MVITVLSPVILELQESCIPVNSVSWGLVSKNPSKADSGPSLDQLLQEQCWRGTGCAPTALPHPRAHPQVVLILSGNLSFLNWLTIVPSLSCFDDATLGFLFPSGPGGLKDRVLRMQKEKAVGVEPKQRYSKLS